MKKKDLTFLVLISLSVILCITAIPGYITQSKKSNIKTIQTALLNKKYISNVNLIEVSEPNDEPLLLSKKTDKNGDYYWIGTTNEMSFPIDFTIASQFINSFAKTRNLHIVSESYSAWSSLSLADNQSFKVRFLYDNGIGNIEPYSALFFGTETADGTMVRLRTDKKATAYQMQNDIFSYLTTKKELWADMKLFPYMVQNDESLAQSIIVSNDRTFIMHVGDEQFENLIHSLFSLRGSTLYPVSILSNFEVENVLNVKVLLQNKNEISIDVYEYLENGQKTYFVKPYNSEKIIPEYLIEISSWTFERLLSVLN